MQLDAEEIALRNERMGHSFRPGSSVVQATSSLVPKIILPDFSELKRRRIINLSGFEKVVESDEFQNDWILNVHNFITRELELSEDVAISLISSDGTLMKEDATLRKELHPKFLEQGVKKLRDLEAKHMGFRKTYF
jgi:hypothetical protein